jgi:hypothetical protein
VLREAVAARILGEKNKLRPDESRRFLWADYSLGLVALLPQDLKCVPFLIHG